MDIFVNTNYYYYMYQIILTENYQKTKTLYEYNRRSDAIYRFGVISKEKIFHPRKLIYRDKKLVEVITHVLLVKKRDGETNSIVVRDNYGKIVEELMNDPEWVVVDIVDYSVEELFFVTDANRKLTLKEIIKHVILPKINNKNPKQVLILNNKIIVEGINLNMITCKNTKEAIRAYNKIRLYCFDNKITNIVFFGQIPKIDRKIWYKKIHKLTGIKYNRLYRSSSR